MKRFAVISWVDTIFWESDDVLECFNISDKWGDYSKGVYDNEKSMYLDFADVFDIIGVQFHPED